MEIFGLDISDTWIRLALLTRSRRGLRLPIRGEIQVPPGAIVDGEIKNPKTVTDVLRQLVKAAGLRTRQAYVALPERHTFLKVVSIPEDKSTDLDTAVREAAAQHLPYAWDEVYYDYVTGDRTSGELSVLVGAAPRTFIDGYVSSLEAAGLDPIGLEIESLAIARATIKANENAGPVIVLDLGRTRSTLILVEGGLVRFSATVRYAGKELNRFIADELKISEDQAERAKRIFGLDPTRGKGLLRKVLTPQIEILVEKLREVESYYLQHDPDRPKVSHVFLTGSGALLRGIDQAVQETWGRPVLLRPSWIYHELAARDPNLPLEIGYTYATAFGLGILNTSAT